MIRTINMQSPQGDINNTSNNQFVIFSYDKTKMLICDIIDWRAPDDNHIVVALTIPCCNCSYPIIVKPDQVSFKFDNEGKITLRQKISCPARWRQLDDDGLVESDEEGNPLFIRCGWVAKGIESNILNER